ncbi:MAG: PDZ domain-containing protein [Treponema sp.]|nr:PDZ domain-containing protein [Treponema sp.]
MKQKILLACLALALIVPAASLYAAVAEGAKNLNSSFTEYEAEEDIPEEALLGKKEQATVFYDSDDYDLQELMESKWLKVVGVSSRIRRKRDKAYSSSNTSGHRDLTDFAKLRRQKYVFVKNGAFSYEVYLLRPYTQAEMAQWKFGIDARDLDSNEQDYLEPGFGAYVEAAFHGHPAFDSGIRSGDLIIQVDGSKISCAEDLSNLESQVQKGDSVKVTLVRDGEEMTIDIAL